MKEEKRNRLSFITVMLASIILVAVLLVILFVKRENAGEKNISLKESIRLSILSPAMVTKTEGELNKRLRDSGIKPLFYKASIQGDEINIFLDRNRWRDLSLNEKADVLLRVAHICRVVGNSIGVPIEPNKAKPPIHFYDRDSNKELASWGKQGGIIID